MTPPFSPAEVIAHSRKSLRAQAKCLETLAIGIEISTVAIRKYAPPNLDAEIQLEEIFQVLSETADRLRNVAALYGGEDAAEDSEDTP